jgi:hypothetical protein
VTTAATTAPPASLDTPLGRYAYRHLQPDAFFGYECTAVAEDQELLIADPAKALLDLVYLTPGGESVAHLESLRRRASRRSRRPGSGAARRAGAARSSTGQSRRS